MCQCSHQRAAYLITCITRGYNCNNDCMYRFQIKMDNVFCSDLSSRRNGQELMTPSKFGFFPQKPCFLFATRHDVEWRFWFSWIIFQLYFGLINTYNQTWNKRTNKLFFLMFYSNINSLLHPNAMPAYLFVWSNNVTQMLWDNTMQCTSLFKTSI